MHPLNDNMAKIRLLEENPKVSNKMKVFMPNTGPWLLRIRNNSCHMFHGSDAIQIGIIKEQVQDLTMTISIRMLEKKYQTLKNCQRHAEKFNSKVIFINSLTESSQK